MHHMHTTFRPHEQLNSRLNFIGRSVPPLFTGLLFTNHSIAYFKSALLRLSITCALQTSTDRCDFRCCQSNIQRALPSSTAVVNQVKPTPWNNNLKLIITIFILLFVSIIHFSNEEWNIQTETRSHTRFLIRWSHATGTLEFDRFPDLLKPLPTGNGFSHRLVFATAFLTQSLPFSLIKMLSFFGVLIFFLIR